MNYSVKDFYELRFGEGFDIPTAVLKYFDVRRGLNMFLASEVPPGSGLGSSGALCVNMVKIIDSLERLKLSKHEIAETAYSIAHNKLKLPVGKQDEYASTFGGLNFIKFNKTKTIVRPIRASKETKRRLEEDILLFFTGRTRESSTILTTQNRACEKNDYKTIERLHELKSIAYEMKNAVEKGELRYFGELLHKAWLKKRLLVKGITNQFIDRAYRKALTCGALGGKLTGAGGGGYLMLYCDRKNQSSVRKALVKLGFKELNFKFETKGVTTLGEW
jgi:D-glycero-alpha-D-manno-heptose-7-phosphate kinase